MAAATKAGSRKSQDNARAYLKRKGKGAAPRTVSSSERLDRLEAGSAGAGASSRSRSGSGGSSFKLPGNPSAILVASEAVTITALITYDLQAKPGQKLPRPGPPLAAIGFYALLAVAGSFGAVMAQLAASVGALLSLTVLVTGKRGAGILGLVNKLTGQAQAAGV